jgi:NAD(P)-dependent dehydrogenase (short-subunit alcohol dehydrogenase family)
MKTDDFHILITGAGRGLGFSLCECFLEQNYFVHALLRKESTGITSLKKKYPNHLYIY